MLIIFKPIQPHKEALRIMRDIEEWFHKNKGRKVCRTELFKVRRGHIVEDILKHTKDPPEKK